MSEMVERVARAIHGSGYDKTWEIIKGAARRDARAAIAAMREPTPGMIRAGIGKTETHAYQAMIDEALKETP